MVLHPVKIILYNIYYVWNAQISLGDGISDKIYLSGPMKFRA